MLTLDSEKIARRVQELRAEAQAAEVAENLRQQTAGSERLLDWDTSPANPERQFGRGMRAEELERRLHTLLPNLQFRHHPWDKTKKIMVLPNREGGEDVFRCVYENGLMPEHSIIKTNQQDVRDLDQRHVDRKDLPKSEWAGDGWRFDPGQVAPGYKRVLTPWGEAVRGWRTVLLRLIQDGLLTVGQAEKVFGAGTDEQWAGHTGKRAVNLAW